MAARLEHGPHGQLGRGREPARRERRRAGQPGAYQRGGRPAAARGKHPARGRRRRVRHPPGALHRPARPGQRLRPGRGRADRHPDLAARVGFGGRGAQRARPANRGRLGGPERIHVLHLRRVGRAGLGLRPRSGHGPSLRAERGAGSGALLLRQDRGGRADPVPGPQRLARPRRRPDLPQGRAGSHRPERLLRRRRHRDDQRGGQLRRAQDHRPDGGGRPGGRGARRARRERPGGGKPAALGQRRPLPGAPGRDRHPRPAQERHRPQRRPAVPRCRLRSPIGRDGRPGSRPRHHRLPGAAAGVLLLRLHGFRRDRDDAGHHPRGGRGRVLGAPRRRERHGRPAPGRVRADQSPRQRL